MQPQIIQSQFFYSLVQLCAILYIPFVVAVTIYVLMLLRRFVGAHERVVNAMETIARKMGDGWKM